MNLSLATINDIPAIVSMAMDFATHYPFSFTPDEAKVRAVVTDICRRDITDGLALVALSEDIPVGSLLAITSEFMFNRERLATEIMWWVDPAHRKGRHALHLLGAFEHWASHIADCSLIQMTTIQSDQKELIAKIYGHRGYAELETNFLKRL